MYDADPIADFTTISELETGGAQVLVVSAKSSFETLDDYINAALEQPETITFGMQAGGASQIMGALLEQDKGCKLKMVEAGNQTEKITSLLGGYIDACNIDASTAAQYVEAGDMRVLCSFGAETDPFYPDFKPAKDLGYSSCVYTADFWLHGPAGMEPALVNAINDIFKDMETDEAITSLLEKQTSVYKWVDNETAVKDYAEVVSSLDSISEEIGLKE